MAEVVIRNTNVRIYVTQPSVAETVMVLQGAAGAPGPPGADGVVQSIVPGADISVDNTDPANPVISSTATGVTDHGLLTGLGDDDHAQYLNAARHDTTARHGASVVDHGSIGGLADDDHPQYHNNARGDARYYTKAQADAAHAHKGARVSLGAAQSIPTATATVIQFNSEAWDATGWHDNVTNPSRLTVPAGLTGKFLLVGAASLWGTAGTYREVQLRRNGFTLAVINFGPSSFARYLAVTVVDAVPGDFFEMAVQHDVGTNLDAKASDTYLSVHFLGA